MKTNLKKGVREVQGVLGKVKRRDFSGNTGQAVKNSSYQLATTLFAKIGSLLFTIILARMLMPELFGLYSLALSTIILIALFSDLGIGTAMLTFISKSLGRGDKGKAKGYFYFLLKYKIYLTLISSSILLITSYFIANYYYNKPIFYALLAGALYIPIVTLQGYFTSAFQAENNFRYPMIKEIIFQFSRLSLVPLILIYILNFPKSIIISIIILTLIFCHLLALLFLGVTFIKKISFLKTVPKRLNKKEKKNLKQFIIPLSIIIFSGLFFGYIDTIMLGHYVEGTFLGYYGATLGLIGAAAAIISFIPAAIFPIFSRLHGKNLERVFRKTRFVIVIISLIAAAITFLIAPYTLLIYGKEYLPALQLMKLFSLLLIISPLAGIYNCYFISRGKTHIIAKLLIFSTVLNIFLNWFFITSGLKFGMLQAVIGAGIATIISRSTYLIGIHIIRKIS